MAAGAHSISVAAFVFVIVLVSFAKAQDPCTEFVNIGSEKRSVQYIYDPDIEVARCDDNVDETKWYSFKARTGSEIPELNDVSVFHCGTDVPIFIRLQANGQRYHDAAKTTKQDMAAPVCANYGMEDSHCNWNATIKIHWCERLSTADQDVFVYKLKRPEGCSMSYCAGELEACPPGYAWNDVQGECFAGSPVMTRAPILEGPTIVRTETVLGTSRPGVNRGDIDITVKQFGFFCNIGYEPCTTDANGARFRVVVYFDGLPSSITVNNVSCTNLRVEINEGLLRGHFGTSMSCTVQSYWSNEPPEDYSFALESNSYWIGIQAPAMTSINDTRDVTISFTSTVPITCWHCFLRKDQSKSLCTQRCSYAYSLTNLTGSKTAKCNLKVTDETNSGSLIVQLSTNAQIPYYGARYQVTFAPFDSLTQFGSVLWSQYKPPNAEIQVKTQYVQTCSTIGDPHILTVDAKTKIDNYLLGEFTLLASLARHQDLFLVIQVRHQTCRTVSCNCGVIVREGNSVYGVDACKRRDGTDRPRIIRYLDSGVYDGSSVWRDGTGAQFMISMPSGLLVTVNVIQSVSWGQYLNIYLNIPSLYESKLTGMCTQTPDQPLEQYRITQGTSMFDTKPVCQSINNPPADNCECEKDNKCKMFTPLGAKNPVVPKGTGLQCPSGKRKREASMEDSDDTIDLADAFYSIDYDPSHGRDVTKGDKTDEDVLAHCDAALRRSAAYQQCATKIDLNDILNNCKEDVQIADDYSVAEAYASVMDKMCLDYVIAKSNATLAEELANIPSVRAVTSNICPNQCRQRGTCVNGECQCDENFTGPDCGATKNTRPIISDLVGGGLCDLQLKQCGRYYIIADNVYDSSSMQGRIERFSLVTGENASITYTNCSLYVAGEVACELPADLSDDMGRRMSMGYRVSISNDGTLYSNQLTLIVYDSMCLTCHDNGTCQQTLLQGRACFIDSVCYANGSRRNATDECQHCVADIDTGTWTNTCPDSPKASVTEKN